MTDSKNELLPCPFCGTVQKETGGVKLVSKYDNGSYYVFCNACGSSTDYYSKSQQAIAAWNRRATA